MDRPTRRYGLIVLAGLTVVVVGVVVVLVGATTPSKPTVQVVGDSIVYFSEPQISVALEPRYRAEVDGGIGRRLDEMLPQVEKAVADHPFAVVVDLGTNDVLQARTHPDWRTGFDRMVALLAPERCVVITTVSTLVDGSVASLAVAAALNDAILRAAGVHHNFHVVDWNAAVHAAGGLELLTPDRIHPSIEGRLTLADLVRTAVDRHCGNA